MSDDNIPLFPVAEIAVGTIKEHGVLILRLPFLSHSMQRVAEATRDRSYVLTPEQARTLIEMLQSRLAFLDEAPPPQGRPAGAAEH